MNNVRITAAARDALQSDFVRRSLKNPVAMLGTGPVNGDFRRAKGGGISFVVNGPRRRWHVVVVDDPAGEMSSRTTTIDGVPIVFVQRWPDVPVLIWARGGKVYANTSV